MRKSLSYKIKERAKHAAQRIGSNYYSFALASQQKYLEIRLDCHPGARFFLRSFVMVLQQLRFAEIHQLHPHCELEQPLQLLF